MMQGEKKRMSARSLYSVTALCWLISLSGCASLGGADLTPDGAAETPPNIILILADDLGYGHLGSYGQEKIRTPAIDRLARQGLRFTQFYAGSTVCAPSRASLMLGQSTGHTFIRGNIALAKPDPAQTEAGIVPFDQLYALNQGQYPLPEESFTLAEMLKERGYTTALLGKWGLGSPGNSGDPTAQGFDYFYGLADQMRAHNHYPSDVWRNGSSETTGNPYFSPHQPFAGDPDDPDAEGYKAGQGSEWFGDLLAAEASSFIKSQTGDKPFFLMVALSAPHAALQAPAEAIQAYDGLFEEIPYQSPRYLSRHNPRAVFAAMVSQTDRNVDQIVETLEASGLAGNTLIIFTSDNGPAQEGGEDVAFFNAAGGLRGIKRDLYEGGIRVPLIARWDGMIKEGRVSDHVAAFWDIMPTLADVAGAPLRRPTEGVSFLPTLTENGQQAEHAALYWEFHELGGRQAVRMGKWKGIRNNVSGEPKPQIELYDLASDPAESTDLSRMHPDVVALIEGLMESARSPSWNEDWNF